MANFAVAMVFSALDKISPSFHKWSQEGSKFEQEQKQHFKGASEAAKGFKEVFAGSLAAKAVAALGRELSKLPAEFEAFAGRGEEVGRMAKVIGVGTDELQRFRYAAKMSGLDTGKLDEALKKMNEGMGQLARHQGPLVAGLQRINPQLMLQIKAAKSTKEAFLLVSDAMLKTTNAQKRAAMAQAVFGKAGQEMIPMLLKGRDGLAQYMNEASEFGSVLSKEAIEASEKFVVSMKHTKGILDNIKSTVLGGLLEKLNPILDKFVAWVAANKDLIASRIDEWIGRLGRFIQGIGPIFKFVLDLVAWLVDHKIVIIGLYAAWIAAQMALNVAMDANPIGLVTLAIEGMIAVVAAVILYWHQITTALQSAWNWFNKLFSNPWIAGALYLIASPIWLIITAVRTLVDLLSGKGWSAFKNFIPPGVKELLGMGDKGAGEWNSAAKPAAPNAAALAASQVNVQNQVNVDNSRAPGTTSTVRVAPQVRQELLGAAGGNNL